MWKTSVTDGQTDRRTDRQTDGVQTYSPSRFHRWGTNKELYNLQLCLNVDLRSHNQPKVRVIRSIKWKPFMPNTNLFLSVTQNILFKVWNFCDWLKQSWPMYLSPALAYYLLGQWLGRDFCQWAIFSFFPMILKFSMGHFFIFYVTDSNGRFFKWIGLWRMAPCLPNHR